MNTAELKTHLLKLVAETEDTSILKKVDDYFMSLTKKSKKTEWWDKLSKEQRQERRFCWENRNLKKAKEFLMPKPENT